MNSRSRDQAPPEHPRDEADKHALRLHLALQRCRPVVYRGCNRFIAAIYVQHDMDEMDVYLTGDPTIVHPSELTFAELPT